MLGGDSSSSPLSTAGLKSQAEHADDSSSTRQSGLASYLEEIRLKIFIVGAPVTVAISWLIQGLSDGKGTDAVGICSIHRLFINVLLPIVFPVKWVRQGSTFTNGIEVS